MKGTTSNEPTIFRSFGRMKSSTTYRLPDFLYTYVVSGSGMVTVGSEKRSFAAGDSFVVAPRQEAVVTLLPAVSSSPSLPSPSSSCFHTIHIRISVEEVEDYFLHNPCSLSAKSTEVSGRMVHLQPDHPLLHGLNLLLADGMRQGFRATWIFTKMKIQECIHILVSLNEGMYYWLSSRSHPQKIDLREFMEQNFCHNIPLEQLAVAAGRSLSTFRRDFVREFGLTPSRWLITRRLEEAYRLILAGKRPGEILIELGFESFSHFTRCFRQQFGVLPSEVLAKRG